MKTIKIILEYDCFPLWIYDEQGCLLDNCLPKELSEHEELKFLLHEIQNDFNGLYVNNSEVFEFTGFADLKVKKEFLEKIKRAYIILKDNLGDKYHIENMENS